MLTEKMAFNLYTGYAIKNIEKEILKVLKKTKQKYRKNNKKEIAKDKKYSKKRIKISRKI